MKIQIHTQRKMNFTATLLGIILTAATVARAADPRTNSWFTTYAGKYARIYTTDANKTNGVTATTWSNGSQTQSSPAYSGIQEVYSSSNWVYLRTTGLGSHTMGPWYNDAARTTAFVNMPVNQKVLYRIPRTPTVPASKSNANGEVGYMVDGVKIFDARDAVSYINSTGQDGNPPGGGGSQGDGIWNRDAYVNETITFDPSLAHQQNTGVYHYHASPFALRYLLGDNINFNSVSKIYSANTNTPAKHSPIVGWANDGYPIYGPYGYSSASNSASGLRRMVSGFVLRDGSNGTTNLNTTGRHSLPAWAQRAQGITNLTASQYGPNVSASFPLSRYTEDNDYLGDLGQTQGVGFDLDEFNGRWCFTPEFPSGTYAYFNVISTNGNPAYPYNVGRQYYGSPTAGTVTSITETVATNFLGASNLVSTMNSPVVKTNGIILTWSALEGGTYQVEGTTNLASSASWSVLQSSLSPNQITGGYTNVTSLDKRFYRAGRTALASYDSAGSGGGTSGGGGTNVVYSFSPGGNATRGQTVIVTNTLATPPPSPPLNAPLPTVTLAGSIIGSSISHPATNIVVCTFAIPSGTTATNLQNIVITFSGGPPPYTNIFTINP